MIAFDVPHASLLVREPTTGESGDALVRIQRMLEIDVNASTQVLSKLLDHDLDGPSTLLASLLRQTTELGDALSCLITTRNDDSGLILVRTQFECLLAIKYIVLDNSPRKSKQYSYMRLREDLDAATKVVEAVESNTYHCEIAERVYNEHYEQASRAVKHISERFESDFFRGIDIEFAAVRKPPRRIKYPHWYTLFDGPRSLKRLASLVESLSYYDAIYGPLSRVAHAKDATTAFSPTGESKIAHFSGLRSGHNVVHVVTLARSMLFGAIMEVAKHTDAVDLQELHSFGTERLKESQLLSSLEIVPRINVD